MYKAPNWSPDKQVRDRRYMGRQRAKVTFKAGDGGKEGMVKTSGKLNREQPVSVDYIRDFVNRGGASAAGMGTKVEGHWERVFAKHIW